jgi:magnesium transporter
MKAGYAWQEALAAMDSAADEPVLPVYRIRSWQLGAILYMAGNILQFFSYAFAAQSLLLALSSVQFAAHLAVAWLMEGVSIPWRSIAGAGVVISSNVLIVFFSSKSSTLMDAEQLVALVKYAFLAQLLQFARISLDISSFTIFCASHCLQPLMLP